MHLLEYIENKYLYVKVHRLTELLNTKFEIIFQFFVVFTRSSADISKLKIFSIEIWNDGTTFPAVDTSFFDIMHKSLALMVTFNLLLCQNMCNFLQKREIPVIFIKNSMKLS